MKVILALAIFTAAVVAVPVPNAVDWRALADKVAEIDKFIDDVTQETLTVASQYQGVRADIESGLRTWQNADRELLGRLLGRIEAEDLTPLEASSQYIQLLTRNLGYTRQTTLERLWGRYSEEIYSAVAHALDFTGYSALASQFFDILEERQS